MPTERQQEESIVAVMDILGFSRTSRELSLDELEKKLKDLMNHARYAGLLSCQQLRPDGAGRVDFRPESQAVDFAVVSDTVVLYPGDRPIQPLRSICRAASSLFVTCLSDNWLLRGAIDHGPFRRIMEPPASARPRMIMFIGPPVCEAHRLEQAQEWGGCILSDTVCERFHEEIRELLDDGLLVSDYDVPVKEGTGIVLRKCTVLNWCWWKHGNDVSPILDRMLQEATDERAAVKVQATIRFADTMKALGRCGVGDRSGFSRVIKAGNVS